MNTNMINIDDISQHLLTMTQLRRRPGEVFQKLPEIGMYIVLRNGKQVGRILPIEKKITKEEIEKNNDNRGNEIRTRQNFRNPIVRNLFSANR